MTSLRQPRTERPLPMGKNHMTVVDIDVEVDVSWADVSGMVRLRAPDASGPLAEVENRGHRGKVGVDGV